MADFESAPTSLCPEQAAQQLRLSTEKVRSMLRAGLLPGEKIGRSWRIDAETLKNWSSERNDPQSIEEQLRRSEELFRTSFDCAVTGKGVVGSDGRWIMVNAALCRLVGYSEAELLELTFKGITHPDDYDGDWTLFQQLVRGEIDSYQREKRYIHKDGHEVWILLMVAAVHDAQGRPLHFVSEMQDITDRKRAEETRSRLFQQLQIATSTARLGIWSMDVKTGDIDRNDVLIEMYGGDQGNFVGVDGWRKRVHPDDLEYAAGTLRQVFEGRQVLDVNFRIIRPDGEIRHINASASPVMSETGELTTIIGINIDVTEHYRDQEALRLAQEELEAKVARRTQALTEATEEAQRANLAKSEFLSRTSHELRTPLNAILGFAQILEIDDLREDQRQSVEYILRGGRHLLDLIDELLALARLTRGQNEVAVEPVALEELMDEVLSLIHPMADQHDIRLITDTSVWDGLYVLADGQKLRQVLLNLLSNAIKYNRAGGKVMLSCEVAAGEPDAAANPLPGQVRILVADTGIGISAHQKKRLYLPFNRLGAERTNIEGTGLGLTISKALVEAMKGTLSLKSEAGRGSEFCIELPLAPSPPKLKVTRGELATIGSNSQNPRTILYIEDNLSNFALIQMLLRGYQNTTLLSAMQGSIGLDLAAQHRPDLILLDLHLPDVMGDEVMRRLRANRATKNIPIAILSADATPDQIERLCSEGAIAYLTKPLDVKKFMALMETTLA